MINLMPVAKLPWAFLVLAFIDILLQYCIIDLLGKC